jgi:hypothetical protein
MNIPHKTFPSDGFIGQKRTNKLQSIAKYAPSKVGLFERVFCGEASPRQAIKAFCSECVGFDQSEIENCTATDCPLYAYRPQSTQVKK